MTNIEAAVRELVDAVQSKNGVCPPPEERTPEQRQVLARAAVLGVVVSLYADRHPEAFRKITMGLPKDCTPITVEEMDAEINRQADEIVADMRRVFATPAAAPTPAPTADAAEAKRTALAKRVVMTGPCLLDAGDLASRALAKRLLRAHRAAQVLCTPAQASAILAEVHAEAEQLIVELEQLV